MLGALAAINPAAAFGTALSMGESALAYKGQKDANETNMAIAQKQMDFQKEMSNTAYQRSMADMKKAGLNPLLAYKMGGASTPIGASIPVQNEFGGMQGSPSQVASSAAGLGKTFAETDRIREDIKMVGKQMNLTDKQINKVASEIKTIDEKLKGITDENVAKDIIAKHFQEFPASALAEHFGGKSVGTLGSVLGSTGVTKYLRYLKETIDRVKDNFDFDFSPSWNTESNTNVPPLNPLTDRY